MKSLNYRFAILAMLLTAVPGCTVRSVTEDPLYDFCHNGRLDTGETDVDCGGSCGTCAVTKVCAIDADCSSATCVAGKCYDATCRDNELDETETDVDCGGGACPACKDTQKCQSSSDCVNSNPCLDGICYDPTCNDGNQNNNETGIDCGGDKCPACGALSGCKTTSHCKSGNVCIDEICYSVTCQNNTPDTKETDTDCGGGVCPPCVAGKLCLQNSDCAAGNDCLAGKCYPHSCNDSTTNNTETDTDCGGSTCPVCTKGKTCAQSGDCEANTPCSSSKCGDPKCFNNTPDTGETDKDCGGNCAPCGLTKICSVHADCKTSNCSGGTCAPSSCTDQSQNQGESAIDCGDPNNLCPRCDTGATCTDNTNCASAHCVQGYCVAATCEDGILNGKETGKDCGGGCSKSCPDDSPCNQPTDCISGVCKGSICKAASCSDGVQNGQETGKDCGGSCLLVSPPQTCPNGEPCNANADCTFNNCASGTCQPPTCANDVQDANETDKNCGGNCSPCGDNLKCLEDTDCQSKVCDATKKLCSPPTCTDAAQNGNETDVNCGGVTCAQRCTTDQKCLSDSDCQNKVCDPGTNKCAAASCNDSAQNGNETGFNCGGSCALSSPAKTCGTGVRCNEDGDCTSNNCCTAVSCGASINTCVAPSCTDGKKNQGESGIDCGGDFNLNPTGTCAARCSAGQSCLSSADCDSKVCGTDSICKAPTCVDGVKNGTELGKDCGSAACSKGCPVNTPCTGPGDCDSGVCATDTNTCAAPSCFDTVQNGTETDLNCGGGCAAKCAQGQGCIAKGDCDPTVANIDCINYKCSVPSCKDGSTDGDESDQDCGGSCDACENGKKCKVGTDCTSLSCKDDGTGTLRCQPASCGDSIQNQGESGIDCGGSSTCNKCDTGYGCARASDCINGVCGADNKCAAPTCSDGVQNQQETDVSGCGGPNCRSSTTACDPGKTCKVDLDCKDLWCLISSGTTGICTVPSCTDTYQNGSESDTDCGGTCTTRCADNLKCNRDGDCAHSWCSSGKCGTPACTDTVQNGTETGQDCGSNCAASCATAYDSNCKQCSDGSGCSINNDCKSLSCGTGGTCLAPSGTSTAAACVGKVFDGTACDQCTTVQCRNILWCFYVNSCTNPGTIGSGGNITFATCANGGVCSVNTLPYPSTTFEAAVRAYRCACP